MSVFTTQNMYTVLREGSHNNIKFIWCHKHWYFYVNLVNFKMVWLGTVHAGIERRGLLTCKQFIGILFLRLRSILKQAELLGSFITDSIFCDVIGRRWGRFFFKKNKEMRRHWFVWLDTSPSDSWYIPFGREQPIFFKRGQ